MEGVNNYKKYFVGRIEKTSLLTSVSDGREEEFSDD